MEIFLVGIWIGLGVTSFKYLFFGDSSEKMAPILYVVSAAFGPLFIGLALIKLVAKGFEWLFKGRV
ncbi:MAG: hypothetical protein IPM54_10265 [Polyangiaceae bacterium]|nr:hypothetical protein [Polyangiaceae bacterium]